MKRNNAALKDFGQSGLIDKAAELANSSFMDKAPAEVVEKERAKIEDAKNALGSLMEQRGGKIEVM